MTALLRCYLAASAVAAPVLGFAAKRAHHKMGADAARVSERLGRAGVARPEGPVIWFNAASVGETVSVLDLARDTALKTGARILVTTTTQTAAETLATRLPEAIHQFAPLDTPRAVRSFLDHWRPDLICYVENEVLPRMMQAGVARGVPSAVLNARPSKTRRRAPRSFGALMDAMDLVSVQDTTTAAEFAACGIGAERLFQVLNLKASAPPPPADHADLAALQTAIGDRPVWAAVSTHEGEEDAAIAAHHQLSAAMRGALSIVMPRHPARGDAVAQMLRAAGILFARRSEGALPQVGDQVYLMDSLGETGLVFRAVPLIFLGGSLARKGGHNPYEPAALGVAVLHGADVANFTQAYAALTDAGGCRLVKAQELGATLCNLMGAPEALASMQRAAAAFTGGSGAERAALTHALAALVRGA